MFTPAVGIEVETDFAGGIFLKEEIRAVRGADRIGRTLVTQVPTDAPLGRMTREIYRTDGGARRLGITDTCSIQADICPSAVIGRAIGRYFRRLVDAFIAVIVDVIADVARLRRVHMLETPAFSIQGRSVVDGCRSV